MKISNLIQLLVSVMSQRSKSFSVDLLEFLIKIRHLKNLKKSANKCLKNKKINQYDDEKKRLIKA